MTKDQELSLGDAHQNLHRLNDWERSFIERIWEKDSEYELSEKQAACLKRISEKLNVI